MMLKKALIVFPPQWCPYNPYPAVPTLSGSLKKHGFPAEGLDLNIRFFRSLLSEESLSAAVKRAYPDRNNSLPPFDRANEICERIDRSIGVFKNKDLFFQPDLLFRAKADVNDALEIISAPYAPTKLLITDYFHRTALYDIDVIAAECKDPDHNIFYDFLNAEAEKIARCDADYILISVTDLTQILAVFTLCMFLRGKCDKPVCIGGNIVTKLKQGFIGEPRFFEEFTDYILTGPGETAVPAFAGWMSGTRSAESVPGLIYKDKDGNIASNAEGAAPVDDCVFQDYTGFDFDDYFSPEPDCSIQLSTGCYWGKCAFCDVSFNREKYVPKAVETAVEEIARLAAQGIRHIHLGDSSVSPAYFDALCDKLIERQLRVFIFAFARLETAFTDELFAKMYRAGVRLIFWGYESESPRVMRMINKGISLENRLPVLKRSADAGIWNHVSFMMGFPGETKEEALETLRVIRENRGIVDSCFLARFSFKTNAKIHEDMLKYPVACVKEKGILSTECTYTALGMSRDEIRSVSLDFRRSYLRDNMDTLWPMVCDDLEHLLFYLSYYGRERVRAMRVKDVGSAKSLYKKFLL